MSSLIEHFIAGTTYSEPRTRTGAVHNPSTGEEIARCAYGSFATVDHAVMVATEAGRRWGRASHAARQAVIYKLRELMIANLDTLAEAIGREHGKTILDAKGELGRAIEGIEFACNAPHVAKGEYANTSAAILRSSRCVDQSVLLVALPRSTSRLWFLP